MTAIGIHASNSLFPKLANVLSEVSSISRNFMNDILSDFFLCVVSSDQVSAKNPSAIEQLGRISYARTIEIREIITEET